ncbi:MAG: tyrosine-type recombinase/integrase [Candidatus Eremiobacterota bacterium]
MLDSAPWQRAFREFMELRAWSPRTMEGYLQELPHLFAFLDGRGVTRLSEVTRDLVEAYRLELYYARHRGRPLHLSSQSRRLSAVKAFFRFLRHSRHLLVDPAAEVERPRVPRNLPRVLLTEKEAVRLLEAPDVKTPLGLRDRSILELLYSTGIRNSELRGLQLDDLLLSSGLVVVRFGKGGKSRVLPLGEEAAYWLEQYLRLGRPRFLEAEGQPWVFLSLKGGPLRTREALSEVVKRAVREAGIQKPVRPHGLRHAVATHMLRRGASLRHLQELLGHASAGTTQVYTRVEISDLRRVHRRTHPRERGREKP